MAMLNNHRVIILQWGDVTTKWIAWQKASVFLKPKSAAFPADVPRKKNILGLDSDSPKHKKK